MIYTISGLGAPTRLRSIAVVNDVQLETNWWVTATEPATTVRGIRVIFTIFGDCEARVAYDHIHNALVRGSVEFLQRRGGRWFLNLDILGSLVPELVAGLVWATGSAEVETTIEFPQSSFGASENKTVVLFTTYKDDLIMNRSHKIFLSHKGADKPLVRRYSSTLKALGFNPWLDEDAMVAGTELDRGILKGFKDSLKL